MNTLRWFHLEAATVPYHQIIGRHHLQETFLSRKVLYNAANSHLLLVTYRRFGRQRLQEEYHLRQVLQEEQVLRPPRGLTTDQALKDH